MEWTNAVHLLWNVWSQQRMLTLISVIVKHFFLSVLNLQLYTAVFWCFLYIIVRSRVISTQCINHQVPTSPESTVQSSPTSDLLENLSRYCTSEQFLILHAGQLFSESGGVLVPTTFPRDHRYYRPETLSLSPITSTYWGRVGSDFWSSSWTEYKKLTTILAWRLVHCHW